MQPACSTPPFPMADGMERDYYLGKVSTAPTVQRAYVEAHTRTTDEAEVTSWPAPVSRSCSGCSGRSRSSGRSAWCSRRRPSAALGMALTMIILGVFYIAQGADFLGIIQIFVYTGAVIMLFLFVVMLIGIDSSDSLVETIAGSAG